MAVPTRLVHRGFRLRLENGFAPDEARVLVDRALSLGGDRVSFVAQRPSPPQGEERRGRAPRVFVKAEFRRPDQPLSRRLKPTRALTEGRGYRAFAAAGVPVPRLFAFGEQSRLRPRGGGIVVTEKLRGRDAAVAWKRGPSVDLLRRAALLLASVHRAGLVHGDAVLRNFVVGPSGDFVIDLPSWGQFTDEGGVADLALLAGSAMKLGANSAHVAALVTAYGDAPGDPGARLPRGWRPRVVREADAFRRYLLDRDATRAERHARRGSTPRPRERAAES
jgi:tRNA A-37 threonylcarbamoyl transferase component Bud32